MIATNRSDVVYLRGFSVQNITSVFSALREEIKTLQNCENQFEINIYKTALQSVINTLWAE